MSHQTSVQESTATITATRSDGGGRGWVAGRFERFRTGGMRSLVIYIGFVLIFALFSITLYDRGFLTSDNLLNIVRQSTPVLVMAVGMTYVVSTADIDLSVGSTVGLAALGTALALRDHGLVIGLAAGVGIGAVVGLANGVITTKMRLPSFLVTLGMMSLVAGVTQRLTNLVSVPIDNEGYNAFFGSGDLGPIPGLLIWAVAVTAVAHAFYRRTRFGRHVLAVGGNREAASSVGINTDRLRIAVFVISGVLAGLAGMLYAGTLHSAQYMLGTNDLLTAIAATVIGGTSLFGGRGSIVGAALGALLMGMLNNGLVLMGLSVAEQTAIRGLLIILAVSLSMRERKA
ncbi:MAG TPA: ABC transporter permease [Mycobacteriales bacterium]|jgi:ribose transport system permease protein